MSTTSRPVPTFPAPRLGDPAEQATWADLPQVVPSRNHEDWEIDNGRRACLAALALRPYGEKVCKDPGEEEVHTLMTDLVADLRHLADAMGIDFEDVYARACAHYHLDLTGRAL